MSKPPERDLDRIRLYCETQVPKRLRDLVRVEHRVRGKTVTIFELQPLFPNDDKSEWMELEQARMKYDESTGAWTLYWFDRNSKAHRYDLLEPHQPIQRILAEIDEDPTCIFKG